MNLVQNNKIENLVNSVESLASEAFKIQDEMEQIAKTFIILDDNAPSFQSNKSTKSVAYKAHGEETSIEEPDHEQADTIGCVTNNSNIKQHLKCKSPYKLTITSNPTCDEIATAPYPNESTYNTNNSKSEQKMTGNLNLDSWNEQYEQLVAYKAKYGHINLPRSEEYNSLINWVNNNRKYMRRESYLQAFPELKRERMEKLKFIGVSFTKRNYDEAWEDNFEALKIFIYKHGRLPKRRESQGQWLQNQRRCLNNKNRDADNSRANRIEYLISNIPKKSSNESLSKWMENFNSVQNFVVTHGQLPSKEESGATGTWLLNQRHKCLKVPRRNKEDEKIRMEKIRLLESLDVTVSYDKPSS